MHCAFEGKQELFQGLFLEKNWDWSKTNPVLKISFGSGVHRTLEELRQTMVEIIERYCRSYNLTLTSPSIKGRFLEIIERLYVKYNRQVVVLIDEYEIGRASCRERV